ncbi:unnamed protein product [Ectocarpus sp. 6 AP-2014]
MSHRLPPPQHGQAHTHVPALSIPAVKISPILHPAAVETSTRPQPPLPPLSTLRLRARTSAPTTPLPVAPTVLLPLDQGLRRHRAQPAAPPAPPLAVAPLPPQTGHDGLQHRRRLLRERPLDPAAAAACLHQHRLPPRLQPRTGSHRRRSAVALAPAPPSVGRQRSYPPAPSGAVAAGTLRRGVEAPLGLVDALRDGDRLGATAVVATAATTRRGRPASSSSSCRYCG